MSSGHGGSRTGRPSTSRAVLPPRRAVLPLHLTILLAVALACEDYPKDPEGTLDRARGGTLRVGVSEAAPWITGTEEEPGGLEAELIRGFAEAIGAEVEWVWGPQEEHMEALAKFELDLVAGGVTASSPWKSHVGLTRPYLKERWVVGVPPGAPIPSDLEGLEVAVPDAGPAAAWMKGKGGRPVRMEDPEGSTGPVAAPEWELREMGYRPTGHELHTVKHVLAAPQGENELIVRLEEHLRRARVRDDPERDRRPVAPAGDLP